MARKEEKLTKIPGLELIVFDLDYTLWHMYVDTHVCPPFEKTEQGQVVDKYGTPIKYYPDVPGILEELHGLGYKLGIASRTGATREAKKVVELLGWKKFFHYTEIYPGQKTAHFSKHKKHSKLEYDQMLFFDDESRNINDLERAGVISILVHNGVNREMLKKGLERFKNERNVTPN